MAKLWFVEAKRCVQGRWLGSAEVAWLGQWIESHPDWSRKRIARELCEVWDWRDGHGRLKDFAARSLLLKLEAAAEIELPELQINKRRAPRAVAALPGWEEPSVWSAKLKEVQPVRLELVKAGSARWQRWAFYLERYHYLGFRVVGENAGYLAIDAQEREVACLLFGAAAWRCAARDRYLGWGEGRRRAELSRVANNTRFLILPWVRVPHLASHLLGQVVRRIDGDWQARYGHGLDWLETFVEVGRFAGTCYRAANWRRIGETRGRSRQDREHRLQVPVKAVYLYQLAA